MNIELHIDELRLHGLVDPASRVALALALERALTQLLAAHGLPSTLRQGGVLAQLDGGALTLTTGAQPEALGAQLAQAIYEGFQHA